MFKLKKSGGDDGVEEISVSVSTETFIRLALLTTGTLLLILAIIQAAHALLLIFIAFFLAIALNAPVYWLGKRLPGKKKGSRSLATTISFLIVILILGGFLASIVPPLVRQTRSFAKAAPGLIEDFRDQDSEIGSLIRKYHLQKQVNSISDELSDRVDNAGGTAVSVAKRVGDSAFAVLTILVLTFMMLVEGPRWLSLARSLLPKRNVDMADRLAYDMYRVIKGFVNGQVLLAALAALLIMPAILVLHISYPAALFVIVFVCGLIPMVGHTIGAIIITTVALFESFTAAVIILAYYILYQQIENYLVQPRIQANSTNMSPLLVFISVVIGVSFGGLVGGLLAIPVAGCIRIAVLEYLRTRKLIDDEQFARATTETK